MHDGWSEQFLTGYYVIKEHQGRQKGNAKRWK